MSNITRFKNGEGVAVNISDVTALEETFNRARLANATEPFLDHDGYEFDDVHVEVNKASYWASVTLLTFQHNHMMLSVRATNEGQYVSYFFIVTRSPDGIWAMNEKNVIVRASGDAADYADEFDKLDEIDVLNLLFGR